MEQRNTATYGVKPTALQKGMFVKNIRKYWGLLLFTVPGLLVVLINSYLPMVGLIMAFKRIDNSLGMFKSPFIGLENFRFLFATDAFRITRNTVLYNLVFIFVGLVINVALAIAISELRSKFLSKLYQTIIIFPYFLSYVVVGYVVYALLSPEYGFVNEVLVPALHLKEIAWYEEPNYWIVILPLVNFWVSAGMGSIIYLASLTGIDSALYESAMIDGANKRQQIFHITIPMLTPVIIVMTLLSLGNIFRGNFGLFYQVTLNNPALYSTTDVIDTYVYRSLMTMPDMGMTTAASLYQSVVGFVLVMLSNLVIRKISPQDALF